MRLVTYDVGTGPRAGVMAGDRVLDATALLGTSNVLRDVQALLELPDDPLGRLRSALERVAPVGVELARARLRAPVLQPPTVRDFFAYAGHAKFYSPELSDAWYRLPIFYFS